MKSVKVKEEKGATIEESIERMKENKENEVQQRQLKRKGLRREIVIEEKL